MNTRDSKRAIHKLFNDLKNDQDIKDCKLLTDDDVLSKRLTDDFVIKHFIKPFEQYTFYTTKVDGLGAAYEVLGKLSGKDRTAGQFFTPENVVKFMVKLAELDYDEVIFDPACGTARFLTYGMEEMEKKVKGQKDEKKKIEYIRKKQLFGTDDDPTVAKLAKMNMYIHGDGKTNIKDEDGLTQFSMDEKADVILTNPPLGDLDYQRSIYDNDFKKNRLEVIPKRNITKERLELITARVTKLRQQKQNQNLTLRKSRNIQKRIKNYEQEQAELQYKLDNNQSDFEITGKQMKGGALFLNACKHYLKTVRDSNALPEWQGGKLLIILDEGILNTETYKEVCDSIKRNFYIKAIISLTRDTFVPVSNTTTKTSILYAIKKEDLDATQKEPIFYAHAEKVGLDTRKKICANHLFNDGTDILSKYKEFKEKVLASYYGVHFNKRKFEKTGFQAGKLLD